MKILPDQARNDTAISLFSPEEAELDLQENGKFNKRNAEVIRKELARLNRIKSNGNQPNYENNNDGNYNEESEDQERDIDETESEHLSAELNIKEAGNDKSDSEEEQFELLSEIPKKTSINASEL